MSSPDRNTPYAQLDPDRVLDALEDVGFRGDGRLLQLNSYENRVFQVHLEQGPAIVAKFYRPARWTDAQILEEHAFAAELVDAEVPVVAPLPLTTPDRSSGDRVALCGTPPTLGLMAESSGGFRIGVAPCHGGHAPEAEDPATLRRLGRFIGRLHAVGARRAFEHRVTLEPRRMGHASVEKLRAGGHLTPMQEPDWKAVAEAALLAIDAAFEAALEASAGARHIRLHGDCHRGNILWRDDDGDGGGPHFVDLDDACNGPAVQDLWMLLAGDRAGMAVQLGHVLAGYRSFMDFDSSEIRLIEPLRTLRMIHHSAWIADRWNDPAFPAAFPWFGSAAYWSGQTSQLREQVEAMAEPPLEPFID